MALGWFGRSQHSHAQQGLGSGCSKPFRFPQVWSPPEQPWPCVPRQAGSAAGILTVHGTSPPLNFNPERGINAVYPLCCSLCNLCRWSQGAEASSEPGFEPLFPGAGPAFAHFHNPP